MRKLHLLLLLSLTTLLSACTTMETFENRLTVTAAGDELLFVSKYGPIGIATKISEKDLVAVKALAAASAAKK